MIERYARKEMAQIWEPENRFRIWLEIEALACEQQAELGVIPRDAVTVIRAKGNFDIARIDAIEAEVKHDVIAFLSSVAEYVGPEARFIHQGMTSSDVLDTCLSVQMVQAADELLKDLDMVLESIKTRAYEHKDTVCMGRSHGIHAEPVTFGIKLATWYAEMARNRRRLLAARDNIATGAISGAVGTFANIDPSVEAYVCAKLGLKPEPVST
jgi:adenylosuccinate lyase